MSVSSVGSSPDPSAYSYPSTTSSSSSGASSSSSSSSTSGLSSYQDEYSTLQQEDAAELIQVSLGSPTNAASNVSDVLAQAASLQDQQLAQQQEDASAQAEAAVQSTSTSSSDTSSSANDPMNVPTLSDVTSASDEAANAAIDAMVTGSDSSALLTPDLSSTDGTSSSTGGTSTDGSSSSGTSGSSDPLSIPTLGSITSQSDTDANTAIQNYLNAPPGSSFETYA